MGKMRKFPISEFSTLHEKEIAYFTDTKEAEGFARFKKDKDPRLTLDDPPIGIDGVQYHAHVRYNK